jgi:hypothetical protein
MNHRYKTVEGQVHYGVEIHGRHDYVLAVSNRERAKGFPLSPSTIYSDMNRARSVLRNGGSWAEVARELSPKPKNGLAGKGYFETLDKDNDWQ